MTTTRILLACSSALVGLTLPGIADAASCQWSDWSSKQATTAQSECPFGTYMSGIAFFHNYGEDYTYAESFRPYCCSSARVTTNACLDRAWTSKVSTTASDSASPGAYVRGIAFNHNYGENYIHQERFQLTQCNLSGTPSGAPYSTEYISKTQLTSQGLCPDGYFLSGITFHHDYGHNMVPDESFQVLCGAF